MKNKNNEIKLYQLNTKNKSFLKVSKLLKDEGIRNYAFPLQIYDPDLIEIDPWGDEVKDNLVLQSKIAIEISKNLWYFLREILRIPTPGGTVPYDIHRGNLAMTFSLLCNFNTAVMLPRQHYKTYSAVAYYLWIMLFVVKNYSMIFTHKDFTNTVENLKKLKVLLEESNECLPSYLIPNFNSNIDKDNNTEYTMGKLNNSIKCIGPSNNPIGADKAGGNY